MRGAWGAKLQAVRPDLQRVLDVTPTGRRSPAHRSHLPVWQCGVAASSDAKPNFPVRCKMGRCSPAGRHGCP
jgi:hypothetical protein